MKQKVHTGKQNRRSKDGIGKKNKSDVRELAGKKRRYISPGT
jgi:hypothetical protein